MYELIWSDFLLISVYTEETYICLHWGFILLTYNSYCLPPESIGIGDCKSTLEYKVVDYFCSIKRKRRDLELDKGNQKVDRKMPIGSQAKQNKTNKQKHLLPT